MKAASWRLRIGFPLLAKELIEQAARRRTYIIRIIYATAFFGLFLLVFREQFQPMDRNPISALGRGRELFQIVMAMLFVAVGLFMPAITSGVITSEKERDSLGLILLTQLRPWEILLEKYLSRIIPMFMFLLLALPPLALCYSVGGVTPSSLIIGIYMLVLGMMQVGAVALFCSAYCRSTSSAFISSYLLSLLLYLAVPFIVLFAELLDFDAFRYVDESVAFALFPPFHWIEAGYRSRTVFDIFKNSIPILVSIVFFLLLARFFLIRRAFVPAKSALLNIFKRMDRFYTALNKLAGGVILIKDKGSLPGTQPVYWRETTKKSLGKIHYLFRILVILELPALFLGIAAMLDGGRHQNEGLTFMAVLIWIIGMLAVTSQGANAMGSERANQTLEVLLTTPMKAKEIVKQKMRGIRRLMLILWIPFLTVFLLEAVSEHDYRYGYSESSSLVYLLVSVGLVATLLPTFAWLGMLTGMLIKSRARAIITSLAVVVLWCFLPVLGLFVLDEILDFNDPEQILIASPAAAVVLTEVGALDDIDVTDSALAAGLIYVATFLACSFLLKRICLRKAEKLLRRQRSGWRNQAVAYLEPGSAAEAQAP